MLDVSGLNQSNEFAHDNPQQRELLRVCRIGRAQGIKGEVNVWAFTDEPELRFAPGALLWDASGREYRVMRSRQFKKRWIILFEGIADRNLAETLNGRELFAQADDEEEMEDEQAWYPSDLIGLKVLLDEAFCTAHGCDASTAIAIVSDVMDGAAQSLLQLESIDANAHDIADTVNATDTISDSGRAAEIHAEHQSITALVPFVEQIVPQIDTQQGHIRIDPPSGLIPDAMLNIAKRSLA